MLLLAYPNPGVPMSRRSGIPGFSFSWRRALGVSQAQARLSRRIGIPLSRSGRPQKVGRFLGCCWVLLVSGAEWWTPKGLGGRHREHYGTAGPLFHGGVELRPPA
jgi:hypothetical protein